ncbi:hypothetical protein GCM10022222_09900 [Amycolatopsis ultiminotia]|uniref:Uncharacterized protein n=1 Tax=Amycolatopsis ultiminotia TaxID=543629 RepID=A0ABP6V9J2_9PSEU
MQVAYGNATSVRGGHSQRRSLGLGIALLCPPATSVFPTAVDLRNVYMGVVDRDGLVTEQEPTLGIPVFRPVIGTTANFLPAPPARPIRNEGRARPR